MGGKSSAPSPPDYGPLIKANEKTSKFAMKLAQEQWDWARKVYDENKGLMTDTNTSFLKTMENARIASEEDRARYKTLYQPQEDKLLHDLNTYDTAERRDKEVGAAQANVAQQFEAAREQSTSQLESFGINPSDTRYKGLDLNLRTQEAATKAAAGTNAATSVEDKGRALRTAAIDIGKGYPGSYTAAGQLGVNAGGQAQTGTNQTYQTGAQAMGTGPQWLGGSNEALGNWGQALNNQYTNQLGMFNANQNASSGWGSALGIFGGMAAKRFGFAEGGAVPPEISPSGGGRQDDVPVAVSVGEFVVPRETVSWFGEKHFHKLNEKVQKEKAEVQAVPTEEQPVAGGIPGLPGMASGGMVGPPGSPDRLYTGGTPDFDERTGQYKPGTGPIWQRDRPSPDPIPVFPTPGPPIRGWPRQPDYPSPDPIPVFPTPGPPIRRQPDYPSPDPIPVFPTPGPPIRGWPRQPNFPSPDPIPVFPTPRPLPRFTPTRPPDGFGPFPHRGISMTPPPDGFGPFPHRGISMTPPPDSYGPLPRYGPAPDRMQQRDWTGRR